MTMTGCATLSREQFTQTDPTPYGAGSAFESAYVYVSDMPTVMVDPSGMRGQRVGCAQPPGGPIGLRPPVTLQASVRLRLAPSRRSLLGVSSFGLGGRTKTRAATIHASDLPPVEPDDIPIPETYEECMGDCIRDNWEADMDLVDVTQFCHVLCSLVSGGPSSRKAAQRTRVVVKRVEPRKSLNDVLRRPVVVVSSRADGQVRQVDVRVVVG